MKSRFSMLFLLAGIMTLMGEEPPKARLDFASASQIVPVMANNPGQFGAFFKTRVSILNVAPRDYSIKVILYNQGGKVKEVILTISNGQQRNWENFLEEVFQYQGAGSVELDAWFGVPGGSPDNQFLVSAEVYTESPNGRYKTVVIPAGSSDSISADFPSFSPAIYVDANSRTNIGCYNTGSSANQISAELRSPGGALLGTYQINLSPFGWDQLGVSDAVSGGYIRWKPTSRALCYAVVVDNASNDGSFLPAKDYIQ